jgi:hypothetical protein
VSRLIRWTLAALTIALLIFELLAIYSFIDHWRRGIWPIFH